MAAALALDYVRTTQAGKLPRLSRPIPIGDAGLARELDAATRASLEITRARDGGATHTLLAAVQRTLTAAGARLLAEILNAPLTDPAAIAARQDAWSWLLANPIAAASCRAALKGAPDMARALARLSLNRGGPRDLAAIRDGLAAARAAAAATELAGPLPALHLAEICATPWTGPPDLPALPAAALADPAPVRLDDGAIAPGYDAELDAERTLRDDSRRVIATLQLDYAQKFAVAAIKIRHHAQLGYVIEAPAAAVERLRDHPELTLRQGMASGARFSHPELSDIDRRISEAADRAAARERAVFSQLVDDQRWSNADRARRQRHRPRGTRRRAIQRETRRARHLVPAGVGRQRRFPDPRRPPSRGRSRAGRQRRVRAERLRPVARSPPAAADRAEHGGQIHLSAAERVDRHTRAVGPASACRERPHRRRRPAVFPRGGGGRSGARAQHLHGGDDRNRLHPARRRASLRLAWWWWTKSSAAALRHSTASRSPGRVLEALHNATRCRTIFATHFTRTFPAHGGRTCSTAFRPHMMRVKEWKHDVVFLHEVAEGAGGRSWGVHVARLAGVPAPVVKRAGTHARRPGAARRPPHRSRRAATVRRRPAARGSATARSARRSARRDRTGQTG